MSKKYEETRNLILNDMIVILHRREEHMAEYDSCSKLNILADTLITLTQCEMLYRENLTTNVLPKKK